VTEVSATRQIADRVRDLRSQRRWSARQLAEECDRAGSKSLTRGTIAKIESGVRKYVTADELAVLAQVLQVSPTDLLRREVRSAQSATSLPAVAAEGATLGRVMRDGNLPAESNSFIGRERELQELSSLASTTRAFTLCGTGGIGKTRLALKLASAQQPGMPDGAWFVDLADLSDPGQLPSRVAASLGIGEEHGRPLTRTLTDALRSRRMLLVLDNCEHVIDTCASFSQELLTNSPGLRVLATSREPLRIPAETVWQVPPLALPPAGVTGPEELGRYDAIRLFADRAGIASPGFTLGPENAAVVAGICRLLDGLPLAIELAAAWARLLSVEQISARLDDSFRLLRSGERTAPPRQRTLRVTIDWSHDSLSAAAQVLLRRLSVFASWSLEMAERVCADDDLQAERILDLLADLANKSLIIVEPDPPDQTRYRMLEIIRHYAAARLADAAEAAAIRDRLREYIIDVAGLSTNPGVAPATAPWSVQVDALRRLDADIGNVREALNWCRVQGDLVTGMRICTAIWPYWIFRGLSSEGAEWLDSFLSDDQSQVPASIRGPALIGRAYLELASNPQHAHELAADGLGLCRAAADQFSTAAALNLLAETALHTDGVDEAAERADEALAMAKSAGDKWHEGYALGTSAAIAAQRGNLHQAQQLAERALAIMQDINHQWGIARTLLGVGDLARLRRDPVAARRHYLACLAILREVDARPDIARCLAALGQIAMDEGDLDRARQYLTESLKLSTSAGSRTGTARALLVFAMLAVHEGRPESSIQLVAAVSALRHEAHLPPLSPARTQPYLAAAARLAEPVVSQLWAAALDMSVNSAVALALAGPTEAEDDDHENPQHRPTTVHAAQPTLSARERQVADLVALGASNRNIAEQLSVSPATAARHIANIMVKLGLTSRSQIIQWTRSYNTAGKSGS